MYRDKSGLYLPERYAPEAVVPGIFMAPRRPIISGGPAPEISYIGGNAGTTSGASVGGTGRQSGDLLLYVGMINHGDNSITIPSGFTALSTAFVESGGGTSGVALYGAYKYSNGTETTVDGASAIFQICLVFRGIHASSPIGAIGTANGPSGTVNIAGLTLAAASSFVAVFGGYRGNATETGDITDPASMTRRSGVDGGGISVGAFQSWTRGPTGTFAANGTNNPGSTYFATYSIEILVAAS